MQKIIIYILSFLLTASIVCNAIFSYRLGETRRQLEHARMELERHENNYRVIADGLTRTSEVLSQSATTVRDLRKQISAIRENYIQMQNIIDSYNSSCDR